MPNLLDYDYSIMNYPPTKDGWASSFTEPSNEAFSRGFTLGRPDPSFSQHRLSTCKESFLESKKL